MLLVLFVPMYAMSQYYILPTTRSGLPFSATEGDSGIATSAVLETPTALCTDDSGNLYISNSYYNTIRKVWANTRIINTIAGTGTPGYSGDGGSALLAQLNNPSGLAIDSAGNLYIADYNNNVIRKISLGIINTWAGHNGYYGYGGDGGTAVGAYLHGPMGLAIDHAGNVYIADNLNNRIRKVNSSGIITTFAGQSAAGYSGDGGQATLAKLTNPTSVAVDKIGNVYIADNGNSVVRKVDTVGVISTIAGNGTSGYSGDSGIATSAQLANSYYGMQVAVDSQCNIYISDVINYRIRKIDTAGIITTIAGDGTAGHIGDAGLASKAEIAGVFGIAVNKLSQIYIADAGNNEVRKIQYCTNTIARQPINDSVMVGDSAYFSVSLNVTSKFDYYEWELNNGTGWYIFSGYMYSGNNSDTIKIRPVSLDMDGNQFRCLAYADGCPNVSNAGKLIIKRTSIEYITNAKKEIEVWPNPAKDFITVTTHRSSSYEQEEMIICNIFGQVIFENKFSSQKLQIDVSAFPVGMYLIKLNGVYTGKFVKQ